MNTAAIDFFLHQDGPLLEEDAAPEELRECIASLGDEERHALRKYWDRVIWEECIPRSQRVERVPSFAELDERRSQRCRQSAAVTDSTPTSQAAEAVTSPDAA